MVLIDDLQAAEGHGKSNRGVTGSLGRDQRRNRREVLATFAALAYILIWSCRLVHSSWGKTCGRDPAEFESLRVALTAGRGKRFVGRYRRNGNAHTAGRGSAIVGRQEIRAIDDEEEKMHDATRKEGSLRVALTAGHGTCIVGRQEINGNALTAGHGSGIVGRQEIKAIEKKHGG